jgi:type III secretion system YscD/HrpQ family protein
MAAYLIAEEGPLSGLIIRFEEGMEWSLGRDPDAVSFLLEDSLVSRKHATCTLTSEGYLFENLSSVNPALQNGKVISEPVLLREGDIIQIGSTFFRFTEKNPTASEKEERRGGSSFEESDELSTANFADSPLSRWLLKVISGPNAGAEFNMQRASTYILGKDPNLCDIVFQDLSVSRQHARVSVDEEENVFIEDLGSRNGVIVNGQLIFDRQPISSQDLIALGTTSFLIIDRQLAHETIISPVVTSAKEEKPLEAPAFEGAAEAVMEAPKDWKELTIPKKHLIFAGIFAVLILLGVVGMFNLFKSQPVEIVQKHESEQIKEAIKNYNDIQFSFNENNGKLFLVGHVLTGVEKQELLYLLRAFPFIATIDDNVVVDEYVWQNMNALLVSNPNWQGITIHSPTPGRFVMRGYLQTLEEAQALADYMNLNFPYLDRLENLVVIESNLNTQIESQLIEKGFGSVTFQLSNGELVLSGRVDTMQSSSLNDLINQFKALPGIRLVKNFVIITTVDTSRIDVSTKYQVTGFSKKDESNFFVVINGRIFTTGDNLDGMIITGIAPNMVLLEKDGLKFKINYNLQ